MLPALATRESRLARPEGTALQLILGSLLGDSMLDTSPSHPRLSMTHGVRQEEYARFKAALLSAYVRTPPRVVASQGYGDQSCVFRTVTTPAFDFLKDLCTTVGDDGRRRKRVSRAWLDLLTWEGVAFWFMDDGHVSRSSAGLSTHSFTEDEVRLLAAWLTSLGVPPRVDAVTTRSGRRCWTLRFRHVEAYVLIEHIKAFVPVCMAHKIVLRAPSSTTCRRCGSPRLARRRCPCPDIVKTPRALRPVYARKPCRGCGVRLADGDLRRRCSTCRTEHATRSLESRREVYRLAHPARTLSCSWCGADVPRKAGPEPMMPVCTGRQCRVMHRRWRRSRETKVHDVETSMKETAA